MKNKIPLWINIFGGLLAIFGLYLGISGYTNPASVIPGFTIDTNAHQMSIWMTSARNIGMAVVMIYALIKQQANLIGLAFLMRVVTESADMFATVAAEAMPFPAGAIYAIYLLVFITPEIIAIIKMNKLTKVQSIKN